MSDSYSDVFDISGYLNNPDMTVASPEQAGGLQLHVEGSPLDTVAQPQEPEEDMTSKQADCGLLTDHWAGSPPREFASDDPLAIFMPPEPGENDGYQLSLPPHQPQGLGNHAPAGVGQPEPGMQVTVSGCSPAACVSSPPSAPPDVPHGQGESSRRESPRHTTRPAPRRATLKSSR